MPTVLNTNLASIWASRNLLNAQSSLATSVMRLSSGLRINSASDDAAGLGVANSLTSQINGADQGVRNLNDAISMVQTAEGALSAATDMGQRILTLATQGANGTLGSDERGAIQAEMQKLIEAINSIRDRTTMSTNVLLDGSITSLKIQVSNVKADKISLDGAAFHNIGSGATGWAKDLKTAIDNGNAVPTGDDFRNIQTAAQTYISNIVAQRSTLGAYQNEMQYELNNITDLSGNLQAARSRVMDTDYASETAKLTKGQILQQAATAMLAQANQMPNVILTLLK
jgi:flagellin